MSLGAFKMSDNRKSFLPVFNKSEQFQLSNAIDVVTVTNFSANILVFLRGFKAICSSGDVSS